MQIPKINTSPDLSLINDALKNNALTLPKLQVIDTDSSHDATSYEDAMAAFTMTEDQYDQAFQELAK